MPNNPAAYGWRRVNGNLAQSKRWCPAWSSNKMFELIQSTLDSLSPLSLYQADRKKFMEE
jgi:hypothetical protein